MLDAHDSAILSILQNEGRITNAELASRIGLTPGPTLARVNKLESAGFISGYAALVDRASVGYPITVFVSVILQVHNKASNDAFLSAVREMPEVLECHHVAGEEDFILKVVAASPSEYETFVLERLTSAVELQRVKTIFVLSSPLDRTSVPIRSRSEERA